MRLTPLFLLSCPLLAVAQSWNLTEIHRASATRVWTGTYAAGANGAFAYAHRPADFVSSMTIVRQGATETVFPVSGDVNSMTMNGAGEIAWVDRRDIMFVRNSRVVLASGDTTTVLGSQAGGHGSWSAAFGGVSLLDSGDLGYSRLTGNGVFRRAGGAQEGIPGLGWPAALELGAASQLFATRRGSGSGLVISRRDVDSWTDLVVPGPGRAVEAIIGSAQADALGNLFFPGFVGGEETFFRYGTDGSLIDLGAVLPTRNLGDAFDVSPSGELAFTALVDNVFGIYRTDGTTTSRVVSVGDRVGATPMTRIGLSDDAFDGDAIVFSFVEGGTATARGYARATPVPEPASLAVLAIGLAAARRRRRA